MTPAETAAASAEAIGQIGSFFMLDPATYTRGAELGFTGMSFYYFGRCGVLGRVDADVASATLVFFNPDAVREAWDANLTVMDPLEASGAFAACSHEWAQRLPDDFDAARLAELAGLVIAGASPAAAPLFAGWKHLPEPDDAKALAVHRMNVLRELRGNLHGAATLAVGLAPLEAVMAKTPYMAPIFGWTDDLPDGKEHQAARRHADELTDTMIAPAFTALSDAERAEFVELANAALVALT